MRILKEYRYHGCRSSVLSVLFSDEGCAQTPISVFFTNPSRSIAAEVDYPKTIIMKEANSLSRLPKKGAVSGSGTGNKRLAVQARGSSPYPILHKRYQVIRDLGFGGMGAVYLCKDIKLARLVAIKKLSSSKVGKKTGYPRLITEARALAALDHANIVRIWDVVDDPVHPFIIMEYVNGETLAQYLSREAPLPIHRIYPIIRQVCAGLNFAHSRGLIHRDIKPSNILLTAGGVAKLTDFGLAFRRGQSDLTRTGIGMGSPGYAAPEQLQDAKRVDHRVDIFALGAVCYHMLTAQSPQVIRLGSLHRDVELFLAKALATQPEKRFQSVALFLEAFARLVKASQVSVKGKSRSSKGQAPKPRAANPPARKKTAPSNFETVPENLKRDILKQMLTGSPPSSQQRVIWQEVLNLSGGSAVKLTELIDFIREHSQVAISRERLILVQKNRQLKKFQVEVERTLKKGSWSLDGSIMNRLNELGRIMVGWGPARVRQECDRIGFQGRLEKAMVDGKGRLTRQSYHQFIKEGRSIGLDAPRIDRVLDDYRKLLALNGGDPNVSIADLFSRMHPGDTTLTNHLEEKSTKTDKPSMTRMVDGINDAAESRSISLKVKKKLPLLITLAILGAFSAWAVSAQYLTGGKLIAAVTGGFVFGAIGLPIVLWLLYQAVRLIFNVLQVAVWMIASVLFLLLSIFSYFIFCHGLDGGLQQAESLIRQIIHDFPL